MDIVANFHAHAEIRLHLCDRACSDWRVLQAARYGRRRPRRTRRLQRPGRSTRTRWSRRCGLPRCFHISRARPGLSRKSASLRRATPRRPARSTAIPRSRPIRPGPMSLSAKGKIVASNTQSRAATDRRRRRRRRQGRPSRPDRSGAARHSAPRRARLRRFQLVQEPDRFCPVRQVVQHIRERNACYRSCRASSSTAGLPPCSAPMCLVRLRTCR